MKWLMWIWTPGFKLFFLLLVLVSSPSEAFSPPAIDVIATEKPNQFEVLLYLPYHPTSFYALRQDGQGNLKQISLDRRKAHYFYDTQVEALKTYTYYIYFHHTSSAPPSPLKLKINIPEDLQLTEPFLQQESKTLRFYRIFARPPSRWITQGHALHLRALELESNSFELLSFDSSQRAKAQQPVQIQFHQARGQIHIHHFSGDGRRGAPGAPGVKGNRGSSGRNGTVALRTGSETPYCVQPPLPGGKGQKGGRGNQGGNGAAGFPLGSLDLHITSSSELFLHHLVQPGRGGEPGLGGKGGEGGEGGLAGQAPFPCPPSHNGPPGEPGEQGPSGIQGHDAPIPSVRIHLPS